MSSHQIRCSNCGHSSVNSPEGKAGDCTRTRSMYRYSGELRLGSREWWFAAQSSPSFLRYIIWYPGNIHILPSTSCKGASTVPRNGIEVISSFMVTEVCMCHPHRPLLPRACKTYWFPCVFTLMFIEDGGIKLWLRSRFLKVIWKTWPRFNASDGGLLQRCILVVLAQWQSIFDWNFIGNVNFSFK